MTLSELEEIMANDTDDTRCGNHVGLDEPMDIIIDCDGTVSITYVDGRITISRLAYKLIDAGRLPAVLSIAH